jgi:hypothetical protein
MHPVLQRAQEESAIAYRRARAELQAQRDIQYARLMFGDGGESQPLPAPKPQPAPAPPIAAHVVPTPAEIDASRRASFAKLSAADQAVLIRFGAAPACVTSSALPPQPQPLQPQPAQSAAYDLGAAAAARLLGKAVPAPSGLGEIALASRDPDPDPRFDPAAMERGTAEARRLLGKSAA